MLWQVLHSCLGRRLADRADASRAPLWESTAVLEAALLSVTDQEWELSLPMDVASPDIALLLPLLQNWRPLSSRRLCLQPHIVPQFLLL